MTTLTIEIPEKVEKTFSDLVILLGGKIVDKSLNFEERNLLDANDEVSKFRDSYEQDKNIAGLNEDLEAIVFMKYGYHATEGATDIIARKKEEFKKAGVMFWGYGGSSCHPEKQVQQFVKDMHLKGKRVFLAMSFTKSKLDNDKNLFSQYSIDNVKWTKVPDNIKVTGSKHAIVCSKLFDCSININLNEYRIAVGPSKGDKASAYIKGQSDKGCLVKSDNELSYNNDIAEANNVQIKLLAEIVAPFAVYMAS